MTKQETMESYLTAIRTADCLDNGTRGCHATMDNGWDWGMFGGVRTAHECCASALLDGADIKDLP